MAPSPTPSNPPKYSRIWIVLPLLCGLYYTHLYGSHLQIYSAFQHAYTEHIVHLPFFSVPWDLLTEQVGLGKSQPHLNLEESTLKAFSRRIVCVGDLHGDYPNALRVLNFSGVTDEEGKWSGNVDFFVQTGDIIDRGDDTIKLFTWMDKLRDQALANGGVVLSNLGNHEYMNAIGDWRYVYPSEIKTFGTIEARQRILSSGRIGRSWANNYTVTTRLPLHPYLGPPNTPYPPVRSQVHFEQDMDGKEELEPSHIRELGLEDGPMSHAALSFVHGGLSPTYGALVPFPEKINEIGSSFLRKLQRREQPPPYPMNPHYPGLPESTTTEERELYEANGPLWYRGWAYDPEEKACADVEEVLKKTGTRRMIMGHTPHFHNIVARCNGKIVIVDTGISHAYGGVLSALSIEYTFTPIPDPENTGEKQRWTEREVVKALYEEFQDVIADDQREVVGRFTID
ncbi:hypothetical protein GYMLUDRAFT_198140 [Collybiopsis luxurians FD-317 M1]|uniref:Calcineurin-like phosphoesterase domain-containing protein n=1 Tax=Collybiopsis luxurians FD-317 M1 TaxID=944289 RepID=A0A0D0C2U0_9AGAR|nr:hypothetical protein GYMLUDRAFT_198140 [Collybiopsis luxurians FD-317 M1]